MILRLFAILLAVGMLCIATRPDVATPGASDASALVDDADDLSEIAIIETLAVVPDASPAQLSVEPPTPSDGRRPEIVIFRPPRAAAFV